METDPKTPRNRDRTPVRYACLFFITGLVLCVLYATAGTRLLTVSFTYYLHSYSFQLRNVLFLLPALVCFACALSPVFVPVYSTLRSCIMKPSPWIFLSVTCVAFMTAAAGVCLAVLGGIPHIQDSIVQLFQARIFASGSIALPSPAHAHFFDMQYVIDNGTIRYGKYFFGQSIFPLIGVLIGAPWIINPIVGAMTIIVTYMLVKDICDETTARVTTLLLLVSPFYLFMHASFMSHGPHLLLMTSCLFSIIRACTTGRARHCLAAGLLFGIAITIKPYDSLLFLLPFFLYACTVCMRMPGFAAKVLLFALPVGICAAGMLLYNKLLFGGYLTTGYTQYSPHFKLGFGSQIGEVCLGGGTLPGHTPLEGIKSCAKLLQALCDDLFGWPGLSLVFACMLFLCCRTTRWERLMALSFACIVTGYFFLFATRYSICYGPRYYFVSLPALALFTARGILQCPRLLAAGFLHRWTGGPGSRKAAAALCVIFLIVLSGSLYMPRMIKTYGDSYWNVDKKLVNLVREQGLNNALIFVESGYYRKPHAAPDYYNSVFNYNALDLDGPVVYARDFGPDENRILMEHYPGRDYYLYRNTGEAGRALIKITAPGTWPSPCRGPAPHESEPRAERR